MINFIQLNHNVEIWDTNIISNKIWENIYTLLEKNDDNVNDIIKYMHNISVQYNIDKTNIIKQFFNYIIRNKKEIITNELLNIIETIMHSVDSNIEHILNFFCYKIKTFFKNCKKINEKLI